MPVIFALICAWVMYIFVVILRPTTGSPDAHFGIVITEPEEDMLLCARLGCMLTRKILSAKSNPDARLFNFVLLRAYADLRSTQVLRRSVTSVRGFWMTEAETVASSAHARVRTCQWSLKDRARQVCGLGAAVSDTSVRDSHAQRYVHRSDGRLDHPHPLGPRMGNVKGTLTGAVVNNL